MIRKYSRQVVEKPGAWQRSLPRRRFCRSSSQERLPQIPAAWAKTALCRSSLVRDYCSCRAAPRTR